MNIVELLKDDQAEWFHVAWNARIHASTNDDPHPHLIWKELYNDRIAYLKEILNYIEPVK